MQSQKKDMSGPAAAKKEKKRGPKSSVKPDHPKYKEMIAAALQELKKPRGASRQAISNYVKSKYSVSGSSSNHHLSTALKSMVANKALVITKGVGAAGSYKINREATTTKKSSMKKSAKPKKKAASKKVVKKRTNAMTKAKAKVGSKKVNVKKGMKATTKKVKSKRPAAKVNKRSQKK